MSKVIAVIPARAGSKGVIDKNIKLLAGHPLIAYSIAAAKLASKVDRIIVSTDSNQYADIARNYGAEVPFLRPENLAGDTSTDYDFFKHLLNWLSENEASIPQYLVHLRPTTPLRQVSYIDSAIGHIKHASNATALRSAHQMSESAYKAFEIENDYLKSVGTNSFALDTSNDPRQNFPNTYEANGYVDVLKTEYILKHCKLHGDHVIAFTTPPVTEVDTIENFDYLEYLVDKDASIVNDLFGERAPQE